MPNLSDLKKECQVLGLEVRAAEAKAPYLEALRAHFLRRDFPNGLPYEELTPMLCFDFWALHPKEQKAICGSSNWVVQKKLNGCRVILHFVKDVGVFAHSRTPSLRTYRRTELTDRLLFGSFVPRFTATVDCEAVVDKLIDTRNYTRPGELTRSSFHSTTAVLHLEKEASKRLQRDQSAPLVFHVFDIVNWERKDLKREKLCERLSYIPEFRTAIEAAQLKKYFEFPPVCIHDKKEFFDRVTAEGGEGVVLKNLNSTYEDSSSRSRHGWVKFKKRLELDGYVSGFERGRTGSKWENLVSCLIFSVNTEAGHRAIAKVSNLEWDFRKGASQYDRATGSVKLRIDVYGRVARVNGLEMSQRAFRLVHPRIVHWRDDFTQAQCVYSLGDLQAARMGAVGKVPLRIVSGIEKIEEKS